MLRNYLITALRNLLRNKLYELISIVGLAVGFASAIFAALFVRYEVTYNKWIPGYQRVFATVTAIHQPSDGQMIEWTWGHRDAARWLKLDFPEVEEAARIRSQGAESVVRHGAVVDIEDYGSVAAADPSIFTVLPFPALAGDLRAALQSPDGVVLTRSFARKYFGRDAPLGETIEIDQHPMRVTAILADLPTNTVFPGSVLGKAGVIMSARAPFSILRQWDLQTFDAQTDPRQMLFGGTFIRLKRGASADRMQQQMANFMKRHVPQDLMPDATMRLLPVRDLYPPKINTPTARADQVRFRALVVGVAAIGALVLLAACVNYINGVTARAARRMIEIGVRKVVGAKRKQLIVQFLGESLLSSAAAALIAIGIVEILLPAAQASLDRTMPFEPWHDPILTGGLAVAVLAVGMLSGLYPAFVLSSFKPALVLRSRSFLTSGSAILRHGLVGLQFAILIAIASATTIVYRQTTYAMDESAKLHGDQVLTIRNGCAFAVKAELLKLSGISALTCGLPETPSYSSMIEGFARTGVREIQAQPIDDQFFNVYDLQFLAGHAISADQPDGIVINDAARRMLGFPDPAAAIGKMVLWKPISRWEESVFALPFTQSRVVGVVAEYVSSLAEPVLDRIYYYDAARLVSGPSSPMSWLSVRLTGRELPATLRAVDQLTARLSRGDKPIKRRFLNDLMQANYRDLTQLGRLTMAFAVIALLIATLGLLGLSAFTVERRTKELGVRKALGASRGDILRLLFGDLIKPILLANLIAWPAAAFFMHGWLQGFAYRVDIAPWTFFASSGLALMIAIATVAGRAISAARARPVAALRYE